jgi:general secretion pathway protein L
MIPAIRDQLERLGNFYGWWLGALSALLTRKPQAAQPWRILLMRRDDGLEVIENAGGKAVSLATIGPRQAGPIPAPVTTALRAAAQSSAPIVLRLSPEEVVERTIQIPKGASDVIEPVLRNQMNRIVPWPQEETRFGYTMTPSGPGAPDQIDVKVAATTRDVLEAALREARALGAEPGLVDYDPRKELRVGTVIMSLAPDPRLRLARRLNAGLAVILAVCLLAGGVGTYQLWQLKSERAELQARIAIVRKRIAEAGNQNAQNTAIREAAAALIERKAGEPPIIRLIDALSRALPDNAYLTELEIRGATARMTGKSDEATALIAAIEAAPEYEDVGFAATTTRDAEGGAESFTITARATGARQQEGAHDGEQ